MLNRESCINWHIPLVCERLSPIRDYSQKNHSRRGQGRAQPTLIASVEEGRGTRWPVGRMKLEEKTEYLSWVWFNGRNDECRRFKPWGRRGLCCSCSTDSLRTKTDDIYQGKDRVTRVSRNEIGGWVKLVILLLERRLDLEGFHFLSKEFKFSFSQSLRSLVLHIFTFLPSNCISQWLIVKISNCEANC